MANSVEFCLVPVRIVDKFDQQDFCVNGSYDYSLFTTIDLTEYGGGEVQVASNTDVKQALLDLGIDSEIKGCDIYIIDDSRSYVIPGYDIPACGYVTITIYDPYGAQTVCNGGVFDFTTLKRIDLSELGGGDYPVTSNDDIVAALATVGYTATVSGCDIIVESCEALNNIPIANYPEITLIDTNESLTVCSGNAFVYDNFDAIDLTHYGGQASTKVSSNQEVINAFAALNITAEIEGCVIRLLNYTGTPTDVEVCVFPKLNFAGVYIDPCDGNPLALDFTQFDQVEMAPYGGPFVQVTNEAELIAALEQYIGVPVSIDGCQAVLESCGAIPKTLRLWSTACLEVDITNEFNTEEEVFEIELQSFIFGIGGSIVVPDGTLAPFTVKDEDNNILAQATLVVGEDITTIDGVSGATTNWLTPTTGFANYIYTTTPGDGVVLDGATLQTGLTFKFNKRQFAIENGLAGIGEGQAYTITFQPSVPDVQYCSSVNFLTQLAVVYEGVNYALTLEGVNSNSIFYDTHCVSTNGTTAIPYGLLDGKYFDINTVEALNNSEVWETPDPANINLITGTQAPPDLYSICLDDYAPSEPKPTTSESLVTGIRANSKNNPLLLADVETPAPISVEVKGFVELPQIKANTTLRGFASATNMTTFPVVIEERFQHLHNITTGASSWLSSHCPANMIRAEIFIAAAPGTDQDPLDRGYNYLSNAPNEIDPRFDGATYPSTLTAYTNATQVHTFNSEGVFRYRVEFERGQDCVDFSGQWDNPGCNTCNGGNADDVAGGGEPSAYQECFYVIASY